MAKKPQNLDGKQFNDLMVLHITDKRNSYGRLLYSCRCKCGNIVFATASNLKRGEIKRCSDCHRLIVVHDLTGRRFGRLVAQKLVKKESGKKTRWVCRCDCGKIITVEAAKLVSNNTTSCGCAQRDAVKSLYINGTAPCKLKESKKPRITNTSGITGVWYDSVKRKWTAEITFKHKKYLLGRYEKKEEAAQIRMQAETQIFGNFLEWYNGINI